MIKRLLWTIWTLVSSVPKKADKLNLSLSPTSCHHCGQTLTIDHMLLECEALQEIQNEYYTADSLKALFEKIPETWIVGFLREAGFFYLIWIVQCYKL